MSGSVSRGKNDPSESLQMIERPLMTPDELKSMPKGQFVVMKTGFHPMKVRLKLFFDWGIQFDEQNPYIAAEHGNRGVAYAEKKDIQDGIMRKYHPDLIVEQSDPDHDASDGGQTQVHAERHEPTLTPPKKPRKDKNGGNSNFKTVPPNRRPNHPPEVGGNG